MIELSDAGLHFLFCFWAVLCVKCEMFEIMFCEKKIAWVSLVTFKLL